jgi:hypothetical protein
VLFSIVIVHRWAVRSALDWAGAGIAEFGDDQFAMFIGAIVRTL